MRLGSQRLAGYDEKLVLVETNKMGGNPKIGVPQNGW